MPIKQRYGVYKYTSKTVGFNTSTGEQQYEYTLDHSAPWAQRIIYDTGKEHLNACEHIVSSASFNPYSGSLIFKDAEHPVRETLSNYVPDGWPGDEWWAYPTTPAGFTGRAMDALYPKLDNDANIVNFLLEIKDITKIFTSIASSWGLFRGGQLAGGAAESHLNWSFGIAPFWRDIISFSQSYSRFRDRYNSIVQGANKARVHHFREETEIPRREYTYYSPTHSRVYERPRAQMTSVCTIRYRYSLSHSFPPASLGNYLKALGFRPSLKTVWDAIPFSFIADWFIGIGDWLGTFDGKLPVSVTIADACVSSKIEQKVLLHFKAGNATGSQFWNKGQPSWATYSQRHYVRKNIIPPEILGEIPLPKLDNVDLRELVLGAALLIRGVKPLRKHL